MENVRVCASTLGRVASRLCSGDLSATGSDCVRCRSVIRVPIDHGVLVYAQSDNTIAIRHEPDCNYEDIHPNIYAPASLTDLRHLHGGGSGVTVFHGYHPLLGSLVMKHGGHKDTLEVLELANIARQLHERRQRAPEAAADMRSRIPEFKVIYISPQHLRDRSGELWAKLRGVVKGASPSSRSVSQRTILLTLDGTKETEVQADKTSVEIMLKRGHLTKDGDGILIDQEDGYDTIDLLRKCICREQKNHYWKFTLGQKTIGGADSENGADLHTSGRLVGNQLDTIIEQLLRVIQNLQALTAQSERAGCAQVKDELTQLEARRDAGEQCNRLITEVSSDMDSFCGMAVRKNFEPDTGRFAVLRKFAKDFARDGESAMVLSADERQPAKFLAALLQEGSDPSHIFAISPTTRSALDIMDNSWMDLVRDATAGNNCASTDRMWCCGLTDAGIHNMFLSSDFLWLFDLGKSTLMPAPAFLTKFFMSLFHTLGMQEVQGVGEWVVRFNASDLGQLVLTEATANILPTVHASFNEALERILKDVFQKDAVVRRLLLRYVILQLLSDASFCLQRWREKGGGAKRFREGRLGKWLWRCLWDNYVAADVIATYHDDLGLG
eukprot:TRINITY_DN57151_c0_g1_i1.p1 TRINITY_DN57151_c0_g1~~TRINITY_DN57151_c0_g1_i1.p1  ORF type:complete len:611 (+),score=79.89 TRINITY_DN57151_c0_g1_i1:127-1959(+)